MGRALDFTAFSSHLKNTLGYETPSTWSWKTQRHPLNSQQNNIELYRSERWRATELVSPQSLNLLCQLISHTFAILYAILHKKLKRWGWLPSPLRDRCRIIEEDRVYENDTGLRNVGWAGEVLIARKQAAEQIHASTPQLEMVDVPVLKGGGGLLHSHVSRIRISCRSLLKRKQETYSS